MTCSQIWFDIYHFIHRFSCLHSLTGPLWHSLKNRHFLENYIHRPCCGVNFGWGLKWKWCSFRSFPHKHWEDCLHVCNKNTSYIFLKYLIIIVKINSFNRNLFYLVLEFSSATRQEWLGTRWSWKTAILTYSTEVQDKFAFDNNMNKTSWTDLANQTVEALWIIENYNGIGSLTAASCSASGRCPKSTRLADKVMNVYA